LFHIDYKIQHYQLLTTLSTTQNEDYADKSPIEKPDNGEDNDFTSQGEQNNSGDIDSGNEPPSQSTSTNDQSSGIGIGAVVAMAVGGFLIVVGGIALRRKPAGGAEGIAGGGGAFDAETNDEEDLSGIPSASGLESDSVFPKSKFDHNGGDMVDINLSDNV
jgi:hypothetical protein